MGGYTWCVCTLRRLYFSLTFLGPAKSGLHPASQSVPLNLALRDQVLKSATQLGTERPGAEETVTDWEETPRGSAHRSEVNRLK